MSNSLGEFLDFYGFSGELAPGLTPARVIGEERGLYRVQLSMTEERPAVVSGRMMHESRGRESFPAVGDWVQIAFGDRAVIHGILPRRTLLQRKQIGSSHDLQILAANVDTVFVTTSMNNDLNERRLERYFAMVHESGCTPVLLLTKADLVNDPDGIALTMARSFSGVDVYSVASDRFDEAGFFARLLRPGSTSVFVGSSGVGKSTLVNHLITTARQSTREVRAHDDRGKHTTTSRGLFVSRYGGLIIDTPGMRELQLADHAEGVSTQFAEVEDLIAQCRFGDCAHGTEPGCAVKHALAAGSLDLGRWSNYLKLQAEVRFGLRKIDKAFAKAEKERWKKIGAEGTARMKAKRELK